MTNANANVVHDATAVPALSVKALSGDVVVGVAAGQTHSAAWTARGLLYTWGNAAFGALGHGGQIDKSIPAPKAVHALLKSEVVLASCGAGFTACAGRDGRLFTWGNNAHGQLGVGCRINRGTLLRCLSLPPLSQTLLCLPSN